MAAHETEFFDIICHSNKRGDILQIILLHFALIFNGSERCRLETVREWLR